MKALRKLELRDVALLVVALALVAALAILRSQRQPVASATYSTYDASPSGYRAWYELLQRERVAVTRFEERPGFLDRSVEVLIVADPPALGSVGATEGDGVVLAAWVKAGGNMLFTGDGILAALMREDLNLPRVSADASGARANSGRVHAVAALAGVTTVGPVTSARIVPRAGDAVLAADRFGALVVHYPLGRGSLTYAVDGQAFDNAHIGTPDHARLAYALARAPQGRGAVAFDEAVHGYLVAEHWWTALPRRLVVAVLLAAATLGLALAGAALRLGPPLEVPQRRDATTAQYLDALAALLERARAASKVLADAYDSTRRLIAVQSGVPEDAGPRVIAASIGVDGMRRDFLALAEMAAAGGDERDLVRGLGIACRLRREFEGNVRRG
jgi:Domain of unknown function (DUF4350)